MANNKLDLLLKLESDKEEGLRRHFVQAEQHFRNNQQKLQGLSQFRLEYMQQLQEKAQHGLSSAAFRQYHSFINKIDEAIAQQGRVVSTARQVVDQRRNLWLKQQAKTKAIAKLIEKQALVAQQKMAKAEQKMLDEFATNQFFQRRMAV
ncbi:flagellar export protein FliJ [Pseudoalteromonas fenneropenaei]|uniref:Flagellar FliJ protein n=1 Tax=Pseudoalteromonas fenneropenaei TaxID=1737459 RepID=A0ABV7CGP2_9GAMM